MPKTFQVQPGRTVTLPQSLRSGPGRTNMRLDPGAVVTLTDAELVSSSRFIAFVARGGDWREIDPKDAPADAPEARLVGDPNKPPKTRPTLETGAPAKKEP